jgi:ribosomal protein S17E
MNQLSTAFGNKFQENKDLVRTRSFELGGHTFKVKIPLTSEYEAMMERMKVENPEKTKKYYDDIAGEFLKNKAELSEDLGVVITKDDVVIQGRSLKETAKNKYLTELRITEMVRLLVPEEKDFDMSTITYEMVDELFPFSIQLELIEKISETISPSYKETRGK